MTDKELENKAHDYAVDNFEQCIYDDVKGWETDYNARKESYMQGYKDCEEEHKDDTDLATIAYMQGAEKARPKWHNITDWTKQEQFPDSEGFLYVIECKESHYHLCEYEITEGYGQFYTFPDGEDIDPEDVVRWIEIKAN